MIDKPNLGNAERMRNQPGFQIIQDAVKSVFYPKGIPRIGKKPTAKIGHQEKFRQCIYNPKPKKYYIPDKPENGLS